MNGPRYTEYHARCWAAEKTTAEMQEEIARCTKKARHHTFPLNEVGNRSDTQTRADILTAILQERTGPAVGA